MASCKRTQRPGGDVGATGLPTTSREAASTSTETCDKSVTDLLGATSAQNGNFTPNPRVNGFASVNAEQIFHQVTKYEKQDALKNIIKENDGKRILVFVEKIRNADFLAVLLCEQQLPTSSIHDSRVRRDRERALQNFESGRHRTLVATTVDLDIENVDVVVNYDLPKSIDEYVLRIGRTGSDNNRGKAVCFYDVNQDADLVADLSQVLSHSDQPIPDFLQDAGATSLQGNKQGRSDVTDYDDTSDAVSEIQESDEDW